MPSRRPKPNETYFRLQRAITKYVEHGKLAPAIARCERELSKHPRSQFHAAIGRSWLGQTAEAAQWLAAFLRQTAKSMPVRALYCEMTRFEINTDVWDAHALAYDFMGDPADLGWLVGWKTSTTKPLVLARMRDLQRLYGQHARREDGPPLGEAGPSEAASMLLTLRFMELIQAAAQRAREEGKLPEEMPVFAAVHDSDVVLAAYGKVQPQVTRLEPPRPKPAAQPHQDDRRRIYQLDIPWDEFGNSLPFDVLNFASAAEERRCGTLLDQAQPLAAQWKPPRMKLRKRKWRCDILRLGVLQCWALTGRAKEILEPLLGKSVELLPLKCADLECWVMHPLRHIELAAEAIHNGRGGSNITEIEKYAFRPQDLAGLHLFGVLNSPGSAARKAGLSYQCNYVSSEFKQLVDQHDLQGAALEEIYSYRHKP
jgi:hypothetical protein